MNLNRIREWQPSPLDHAYSFRDTILYALGLGYGADPQDESELRFVYEQGLMTVPSLCSVLAHPGFWLQDPVFGVDWVKILHAEQAFEIHNPLPTNGTVRGSFRVMGVEDKSAAKGALLHQEKILSDPGTGERFATVRSTLFLRGDGGGGGFGELPPNMTDLPDRAADRSVDVPTLPQQALIYRLSGDWNPIHADPMMARKAGFDRPILHGLCTHGIACRALLRAYCGNDPARLRSMFVRFSKPVYPGETLRVEFFEEADGLRFRVIAAERNAIVMDRGHARFS
jgi:acyl dehydratase